MSNGTCTDITFDGNPSLFLWYKSIELIRESLEKINLTKLTKIQTLIDNKNIEKLNIDFSNYK